MFYRTRYKHNGKGIGDWLPAIAQNATELWNLGKQAVSGIGEFLTSVPEPVIKHYPVAADIMTEALRRGAEPPKGAIKSLTPGTSVLGKLGSFVGDLGVAALPTFLVNAQQQAHEKAMLQQRADLSEKAIVSADERVRQEEDRRQRLYADAGSKDNSRVKAINYINLMVTRYPLVFSSNPDLQTRLIQQATGIFSTPTDPSNPTGVQTELGEIEFNLARMAEGYNSAQQSKQQSRAVDLRGMPAAPRDTYNLPIQRELPRGKIFERLARTKGLSETRKKVDTSKKVEKKPRK